VAYVASSITDWELAAAEINPDPIRREFECRLRDEQTAPFRKVHAQHRTRFAVGRVADEPMRTTRRENASLIVIGIESPEELE
jgi:hypothetical protein